MHATVVNDEALVDRATDVVDLARLVVQAKVLADGNVTRDLYGLAGGTLSGADVVAADATTGPDALAAIEHVPLPPLVSAIHDVFVFEDEPLAPIPFRAVRQSPGAGTVSFTITSDKPDLLPANSFSVTEGPNPGDFLLDIQPLAFHQGIAHITLHATDSAGSSIDEHFTVTVMFVDHPPQAVPDSALVVAGTTVTIHPLANDLDPDQDPLYLDGLTSVPSRGSVVVHADHSLSYTPEPSDSGVQTIVYELNSHPGASQLPAEPASPLRWYDVDGQDDITPQDVLLVINHINRLTAFAGEGEAGQAAADAAHAEFAALPSGAPWHPADLGLFPPGRPHSPAAPGLHGDSARATAARRPSSGSLRSDDSG